MPARWIGVQAGDEVVDRPALQRSELPLMQRSGVGSIRIAVYWSEAQDYRSWAAVPDAEKSAYSDVDGLPLRLGRIDRIVLAAARRGLGVLPSVLDAPPWDTEDSSRIHVPRTVAPYARFVAALVSRYGPGGTLWSEHPDVAPRPIREWQAWNEPNLEYFWPSGDGRAAWPQGYTELLRATWPALHRADPGARLVSAGMPKKSWIALRRLYAAGARPYMDIVGVNAYSLRVPDVVAIVGLVREEMRHHGDGRKPLELTEFGWPSAKGKTSPDFGFDVTPKGAAERAATALPALARARRALGIRRVFWYTWISSYADLTDPFAFSGLRVLRRGKPFSTGTLAPFARAARRLRAGR